MPLLHDSHTPTRFQCIGEMARQRRCKKTPGFYINSCLKVQGEKLFREQQTHDSNTSSSLPNECYRPKNPSSPYCSVSISIPPSIFHSLISLDHSLHPFPLSFVNSGLLSFYYCLSLPPSNPLVHPSPIFCCLLPSEIHLEAQGKHSLFINKLLRPVLSVFLSHKVDEALRLAGQH